MKVLTEEEFGIACGWQEAVAEMLDVEPEMAWPTVMKVGAVAALMFGGGLFVLWVLVHAAMRLWGCR